jgi:hypothetical protein
MPQEIGAQYPRDKVTDPTGFLEKARLHQSKYRAFKLNLPCDKYGNYLTKEDALKGYNFFSGFDIFDEVQKRYPKYSNPLYANLLRSEHIAFNLFIPLKQDLGFAKTIFNKLLKNQIQSIDSIEIEYAPSPAEYYLNDKTSFDAYIEYTHIDQSQGIIGIEVKYTEHEYPLKPGSKQEKDIQNKDSKYYQVHKQSGIYKPNTTDILITDKFRQVWRNQLLGESILITDHNKFKHFTSLIIFPKGNTHFIEVNEVYKELLANTEKYLPVTYEDFIAMCREYTTDDRFKNWLNYLDERYIVEE